MRSFAAKQPFARSPEATDRAKVAVGTSFLRSGGQPLPSAVRLAAQERFGHDFSRVRVHTEPAAAASARLLSARAYAVADRLVFNEGEYQPGSRAGLDLLRHELTHVAQWKAGGSRPLTGTVPVAPPDAPSEREADRTASRPDLASPVPAPLVQRKMSKLDNVNWGSYQIEMDNSSGGLGHTHVEITFTPNSKGPPTDEIQFIQIAKPTLSPRLWTAMHPDQADLERYTTKAESGDGSRRRLPRGHRPGWQAATAVTK